MNAGEMDRLVTIEKPVVTKAPGTGAPVKTWVTHCQAWAKVVEQAISATDEKLAQDVHVYGRPAAVTIYWVDGIDATMRVRDGASIWQIQGTAMLGRRQGLQLRCTTFTTE